MYRIWSLPFLIGGMLYLARAASSGHVPFWLLGAGMVLGGVFAFRHNLLDISPKGLDVRSIGLGWVALLGASVLLVLGAAVVTLSA